MRQRRGFSYCRAKNTDIAIRYCSGITHLGEEDSCLCVRGCLFGLQEISKPEATASAAEFWADRHAEEWYCSRVHAGTKLTCTLCGSRMRLSWEKTNRTEPDKKEWINGNHCSRRAELCGLSPPSASTGYYPLYYLMQEARNSNKESKRLLFLDWTVFVCVWNEWW